MNGMTVYFRDSFWSMGTTEIYDEQEKVVGTLDLKSMMTEGIDVYDEQGRLQASGKFPFLSNRWIVKDGNGEERGVLRARFGFLAKRYEYDSLRGTYRITSPAFSREYEVTDDSDNVVLTFRQVNRFWGAGAFELENTTGLPTEEWVAVIMGVHGIQKRMNQAAAT
ncbi:hypothetical protein J31TS4_33630 [Paenibacillus sp. J31TS4]|uniref:hypothetical protein n=1 Tax=Paenibacillus sp. J31TS4 TaxID=2807195 RepID=UPI001B0D7E0C|nr:hypothetical protein [Paenibacillus sp. J31TS4]GIP40083.1 hypothetical protein J31TS4_33630 [Paenibacillus sp. J31TS4]